jgi:hypothetical protein
LSPDLIAALMANLKDDRCSDRLDKRARWRLLAEANKDHDTEWRRKEYGETINDRG